MEMDMQKILEKMKQEPRIYFVLGNILLLFFSWGGYSYLGIKISWSGFDLIRYSVPLVLLILVPIGLLVIEFFLNLGKNKKLFYLVLPVVMILDIFIFATPTSGYGVSWNIGIGFLGSIALYILIIGWTLLKDFKISKKSIQENGFKQSMQDVAGQVSESASELKDRKND